MVSVGSLNAFDRSTKFDKFISNVNNGFRIAPSECHDIASEVNSDFASMAELDFITKYASDLVRHNLTYDDLVKLVETTV